MHNFREFPGHRSRIIDVRQRVEVEVFSKIEIVSALCFTKHVVIKVKNLLMQKLNLIITNHATSSIKCKKILTYIKTYSKWNWKKCGRCRTISGHIFANCIDIFHKTEVQKVILRCLRSLYLIWFKSHGTKCSKRPIAILAKSETLPKKLQLINGHFTTILGHFFADCMNIFHKTEVQAVIFRC